MVLSEAVINFSPLQIEQGPIYTLLALDSYIQQFVIEDLCLPPKHYLSALNFFKAHLLVQILINCEVKVNYSPLMLTSS